LCCDENGRDPKVAGITVQRFSGCHPAGLVGTHIHYLSPVHAEKTVWHAHYQDVLAIGRLFLTGQVDAERIVALAGPAVIEPQLVKTSRGASLAHMTEDGLKPGHHRIISGSVLDGRSGAPEEAYLGRYHLQVAALSEGTEREFFGFVAPGGSKFSMTRLFTAWLLGRREFDLTTSTGGSERSMIPLGSFERLAALDILPTQLLRALLVDDVESSIELGCLELDEEDIALFTFACPGKYEYGPYLRSMLTKIEVEG
jgi:Na+-transporting NADH:ubiquinone oxidoreductase subunit A